MQVDSVMRCDLDIIVQHQMVEGKAEPKFHRKNQPSGTKYNSRNLITLVKFGVIDLESDFSLAKIVQFLNKLLPSLCPS